MASGASLVKIHGGASRVKYIYFVNCDFAVDSLQSGATVGVTHVDAKVAYACVIRNVLFDDGDRVNVTHAPLKLEDCGYWTVDAITTNLGAPFGAEANVAKLIDAVYFGTLPIVIGQVWHQGSRTSPQFAGVGISGRRMPVIGDTFTSTPGAVATLNIPHGLSYTPAIVMVQPGNVAARGAPLYYVTKDATNIILNFAANLTAATSYSWNYMAS